MSQLFSSTENTSVKAPRRVLIWLIPLLLLLIMGASFLALGWQRLLPAIDVNVARARMGEAANVTKEGATLFQAAGWVEADPFPIRATALISGIVKKVHVINGQKITKGQLLVSIIDDDLKLDLANAQAVLNELKLNVKKRQLEVKTEQLKLLELSSLKKSAIAQAERMKHKAKVFRSTGDAIPDFEKDQAELEYQEKQKVVEEYDSRKSLIISHIELLQNSVEIANAKAKTQKVEIAKIELDLSRTQVLSPAGGIIEHLYARQGRKQMLGSDNEHSTTIARIFNPNEIQIRVDVPLSDVGKIKIGLKAKIHVEFLKEPLDGYITSIYGHADYQKNTLEVKVKIPGGHQTLRSEMLAQVEFVSAAPPKADKVEKVSGIFIKKESLVNDSSVWAVDANNKAVLKQIQKGRAEKDGWVEVVSGIHPGEKIILAPHDNLKSGAFVKVEKIYE